MFNSRILIVALISIFTIDSSTISTNHQTLLWSPFLRYPTATVIQPEESSRVAQFRNSPTKFVGKTSPPNDNRYRQKKYDRPLSPNEYKKFRSPNRTKDRGIPKKVRPLDNWNYKIDKTKNSENVPSSYLKPPTTTNTDYQYYEKSKGSLKTKAKEPLINQTTGSPKNHRFVDVDDDRANYIEVRAPEQQVEATDDRETNDSDEESNEQIENALGASKDRIQFHIHGHAGPETYMFGFDTGDGENRQYRMEERHGNGTVTGHYGYIDARGKLRKVRYKASPTHGYEEKHHETNEHEI